MCKDGCVCGGTVHECLYCVCMDVWGVGVCIDRCDRVCMSCVCVVCVTCVPTCCMSCVCVVCVLYVCPSVA